MQEYASPDQFWTVSYSSYVGSTLRYLCDQRDAASLQDLDRILAVNVRGVYLCYKYAAKRMIEQGKGGRIIGASSGAGKQGMPKIPSLKWIF